MQLHLIHQHHEIHSFRFACYLFESNSTEVSLAITLKGECKESQPLMTKSTVQIFNTSMICYVYWYIHDFHING